MFFFFQRKCQPSTEPSSNRQARVTTDIPPTPRFSTSIPLSRASSRSTVTLETDGEASGFGDRPGRLTREQSIQFANPDPGPSTRKSKRARSPEDEETEGDNDGEYLPAKRARVSLSSRRAVRTVRKFPIALSQISKSTLLCRCIQHPPLSLQLQSTLHRPSNHPLALSQSSPVARTSFRLPPSSPSTRLRTGHNPIIDDPPGALQGRPRWHQHFLEHRLPLFVPRYAFSVVVTRASNVSYTRLRSRSLLSFSILQST